MQTQYNEIYMCMGMILLRLNQPTQNATINKVANRTNTTSTMYFSLEIVVETDRNLKP